MAWVAVVQNSSATSTLTLASVAIPAGGCAHVGFAWAGNSGQTLTSVTHNGVAMTSIGQVDLGTGRSINRYRRVSAGGETGSVVVTFSAATTSQGAANTFNTVDQTTPIGTPSTSSDGTYASTATASAAVSSAVGAMVVDTLMVQSGAVDLDSILPVNADQTERAQQEDMGVTQFFHSSTEAGAASVTMGWVWDAGSSYAHAVDPINASAAAGILRQMMAHEE